MRPSRVGVPVDFPRICLPRSVDSSSPALSETMLGSQEARHGRGPDSIGHRSGPSLCIPRAALWWHPVPPPSSNRIHLVPCPPSVAPLCWVMTQLGMPGVGMGWRMRRPHSLPCGGCSTECKVFFGNRGYGSQHYWFSVGGPGALVGRVSCPYLALVSLSVGDSVGGRDLRVMALPSHWG